MEDCVDRGRAGGGKRTRRGRKRRRKEGERKVRKGKNERIWLVIGLVKEVRCNTFTDNLQEMLIPTPLNGNPSKYFYPHKKKHAYPSYHWR